MEAGEIAVLSKVPALPVAARCVARWLREAAEQVRVQLAHRDLRKAFGGARVRHRLLAMMLMIASAMQCVSALGCEALGRR